MNANPPSLPGYEPPAQREKAVIPSSIQQNPKPHGIIHKMVGRALKMKTMKLSKKLPAVKKPKKLIKK